MNEFLINHPLVLKLLLMCIAGSVFGWIWYMDHWREIDRENWKKKQEKRKRST
jgi:uncharacterized membrane protein YpjA